MARKKKRCKDNSEIDLNQKNTNSLNKATLDLKYVMLVKLLSLPTAQYLNLYSDDNKILPQRVCEK